MVEFSLPNQDSYIPRIYAYQAEEGIYVIPIRTLGA